MIHTLRVKYFSPGSDTTIATAFPICHDEFILLSLQPSLATRTRFHGVAVGKPLRTTACSSPRPSMLTLSLLWFQVLAKTMAQLSSQANVRLRNKDYPYKN